MSGRLAAVVARELARVPAFVPDGQLRGVLVDGVGDLLGVWAGAACLDPTPAQEAEFERRRASVVEVVRTGLADCWGDAAGQLERAFVLAAQVLAPAEVEAGLRILVDALQPEADLDAQAELEHRSRGLALRTCVTGGWDLRAHLSDEVGQRLFDELSVRDETHPLQKARETKAAAATAGGGVEDVFGRPTAAEPGVPEPTERRAADLHSTDPHTTDPHSTDPHSTDPHSTDPHTTDPFGDVGPGSPTSGAGHAVEGTPLPSREQRAHDAFARLLADLHAVRPGSGVPAASTLTLIGTVAALEGRPGAPPGRLQTSRGDVPLTPGRFRRHACDSVVRGVVLDAQRRPVAASGTHRHATARERAVLRAAWGSTCAVNGCTLPGPVPHHAEPWWKTGRTDLKDLVPLCEHHHHDVHDGHRTLRLRDGRCLDEWGWTRS